MRLEALWPDVRRADWRRAHRSPSSTFGTAVGAAPPRVLVSPPPSVFLASAPPAEGQQDAQVAAPRLKCCSRQARRWPQPPWHPGPVRPGRCLQLQADRPTGTAPGAHGRRHAAQAAGAGEAYPQELTQGEDLGGAGQGRAGQGRAGQGSGRPSQAKTRQCSCLDELWRAVGGRCSFPRWCPSPLLPPC